MLNKKYWEKRYTEKSTGWDVGTITKPLKLFLDQISSKKIKILIPGCGNAHEAAYLNQKGFKNVFLCDWAKQPLIEFSSKYPEFPKHHLLNINFFELKESNFDLIIEQTFLCALKPELGKLYAKKNAALLSPNGQLSGLLFNENINAIVKQGPPFGANINYYISLFKPHFKYIDIDLCNNSIPPRLGNEFFFTVKN